MCWSWCVCSLTACALLLHDHSARQFCCLCPAVRLSVLSGASTRTPIIQDQQCSNMLSLYWVCVTTTGLLGRGRAVTRGSHTVLRDCALQLPLKRAVGNSSKLQQCPSVLSSA
jgi:hypothetical protein